MEEKNNEEFDSVKSVEKKENDSETFKVKKENKLEKVKKQRKIFEILAFIQILIFVSCLLVIVNSNNCSNSVGSGVETIEAFNSKFDAYIGNEIKGTNVKALLAMIRDNNLNINETTIYPIDVIVIDNNLGVTVTDDVKNAIKGSDTAIDVKKWGENSAINLKIVRDKISGGKNYKVEAQYSEKTKFINKFIITLID